MYNTAYQKREERFELRYTVPTDGRMEEKAIQAELAKRLRQAIDAMRPKDREIFLRYYYYLENTDTIAARMDIPAATVRSRLARGREQLKNTLCKEDWP